MSEFTVAAIRFTDDIPSMSAFLADLGMAPVLTSERWADMRAGAGAVWLHSRPAAATAQPAGATHLTGEVDDVDALAARLTCAGLTPTVVDEAYGRSVSVADPLGAEVTVNERQTDSYGYTEHDARPDTRLVVAPVRFTDPQGPYGDFLTSFGLARVGDGDEWFAAYESDGQVGVHHADSDDESSYVVPSAGADVQLGFVTSEDLDELAARLRDRGHDVTLTRDEFVSFVELVDPDGRPVQVHAAD